MSEDPLSSLKVNYSHLTDIADQIKIRRQLVEEQMQKLWQEVKKAESIWQGEAAEMFGAVEKQWDARAAHIKDQLTKIENLVREGSGRYRATDLKARGLFEQIGGW
ncbi:WXG100 family type VII secretion target [Streptomyces qinglanensis]|uniref:WXG100 family type VII secretion target n=1 Tax=Streptomyces qinglanensis TaxID=943816 RepID=UPI00085C12A7|nr:WXG100 family type VII secretion target [Streptomyces qinglanensis]MBE9500522.1 WXG100 family type VII secretion target [Streptomyces sp. GKU 257-1]